MQTNRIFCFIIILGLVSNICLQWILAGAWELMFYSALTYENESCGSYSYLWLVAACLLFDYFVLGGVFLIRSALEFRVTRWNDSFMKLRKGTNIRRSLLLTMVQCMKEELHSNIIGGFQLPLHPRRVFSHAVRTDGASRFHGATEISLNCITISK